MAPNKRAENKKLLNLWLDKDVYARFSRAAEAFGLSMTSILTAFITEKVDEYERKYKHSYQRKVTSAHSTDSERK
jgi:hypothetical protein